MGAVHLQRHARRAPTGCLVRYVGSAGITTAVAVVVVAAPVAVATAGVAVVAATAATVVPCGSTGAADRWVPTGSAQGRRSRWRPGSNSS